MNLVLTLEQNVRSHSKQLMHAMNISHKTYR